MIKNNSSFNIKNIEFINPDTNDPIQRNEVPDFFNTFFVEIASRTRQFDESMVQTDEITSATISRFAFLPPNLFELKEIIRNIDVNMSSCVEGINAKICKTLLEIISEKFLKLFANSLVTGIIPEKWTCASLTFFFFYQKKD